MQTLDQNQKDICLFLDYCAQTKQNCAETIKTRKNQLSYLYKWAEGTPFEELYNKKTSYPQFLCSQKHSHLGRDFSTQFIKSTLFVSRMFFTWAKRAFPDRYKNIDPLWIDSIKVPLQIKNQGNLVEHDYYPLEEIIKICCLKPRTMAEKRGQAAMAFLFLTGMRVGAFLTLPIACIDLEHKKIYQVPSMGVKTKFSKASITTLLNIPKLLEIVKNWDDEVRKSFPPHQVWYAPIQTFSNQYGEFQQLDHIASPLRGKQLRKEMTLLCNLAGVKFRSAHKLRHGHAVFGIKNAKNIQELKAVSQNLMHSSISITDGIYGNLAGSDFIETIAKLGNCQSLENENQFVTNDLISALIKLQKNPDLLRIILHEH